MGFEAATRPAAASHAVRASRAFAWATAVAVLAIAGGTAVAGDEPAPDPAPEPGPIPIELVHPGPLRIPAADATPEEALARFLAAHEAHRKGQLDDALAGYLAFLGMSGRLALPQRYVTTARSRLDTLLARVRERYDAAAALYAKNRAEGLAALQALADRYPALPEAAAARALWHSDALRDATAAARKATDRKQAAIDLERAIRRYPAALYRYEAKALLVELGGPDLFDRDERVGADEGGERKRDAGAGAKEEPKKPAETEIEVSPD